MHQIVLSCDSTWLFNLHKQSDEEATNRFGFGMKADSWFSSLHHFLFLIHDDDPTARLHCHHLPSNILRFLSQVSMFNPKTIKSISA